MLVRFILITFLLVTLVAKASDEAVTGEKDAIKTETNPEQLSLSRGPCGIRFFIPASAIQPTTGIVLGSGDGGWSYWEERVSNYLRAKGFAVAGIDFRAYAEDGYTVEQLREDYRRVATELRRRSGSEGLRFLIYGGWSMGAEQAIPAAAKREDRPAGLRGFLMVAPGARGRYGLELPDQLGLTPRGEDTFSLAELAPACSDLRFAVFHGGLDLVDDTNWQKDLKLDYRLWTLPGAFHDFNGAGNEFLAMVDEAMVWLLMPDDTSRK